MVNMCAICGWNVGYCHKHHIIPKSRYGADTVNNIILLCPNHHGEAHFIGYEKFNNAHNLVGERVPERWLKVMRVYIKIHLEHFPSEDNPNLTELTPTEKVLTTYLRLKFKFTHIQAISYHLGCSEWAICRDTDVNYPQYCKYKEQFLLHAESDLKLLAAKDENYKWIDETHRELLLKQELKEDAQKTRR